MWCKNLTDISSGGSTVGNKKTRAEACTTELKKFNQQRWASTRDIESVRGKLQYMEAQTFGRASRGARTVFDRTRGHGKTFDSEDLDKLAWIVNWLATAVPRQISPKFRGPPLLLFSYGECEDYMECSDPKVTFGAVLLDRRDNTAHMFGATVCPQLLLEWKTDCPGKKQFVTEAELLPSLIARVLWRGRIAGTKFISFIDSNPSRFALIRGSSDSLACERIVRAVCMEDTRHVSWPWYARVPSKSNPADDPSRLVFPSSIPGFDLCIYEEVRQPQTLKDGDWAI